MKKIKWPAWSFGRMKADIQEAWQGLTMGTFRQIFERIDQLGIKKGVDEIGLEGFINQCAWLAAGSGVITGIGGPATMLLGVPIDTLNLLTQQFRITLAISYAETGDYHVRFEDFVRLANTSLKEEAGVAVSKAAMEEFAKKLMVNMGVKTTRRMIPVFGALIGGSANYLFIKQVAKSLKKAG